MKVLAIALMAFMGTSAQTRSQTQNTPVTVEKLCGKLQHFEEVPIKNAVNTFEDKTKNLPRVTVQLYRADDDRPCCNGLSLVAETKTGRWGSFHLKEKKLAGGLYWIVVQPSSREYRLLVRYEPGKSSAQLCSETFFQLDDAGKFWKTETIYVE